MEDRTKILHAWLAMLTGLIIFAISVHVLWQSEKLLEAVVLQTMILISLWIATTNHHFSSDRRWAYVALWAMLVLLFLLAARVRVDFLFIYSIIWIGVAGHYFSASRCWLLLLLIGVGWYLLRAFVWQHSSPFLETILLTTFHAFALMSSLSAIGSAHANERTQALNRELIATQHLLGEFSRERERTRIARDLHDLLGHHLTALTINLQVAGRLSSGEAKDKIEQCHGLAKLLLSDVREAVTTLRETPTLDLQELLTMAVKDVPRLNIDLQVEPDVTLEDVQVADVLLRCVQEAITNTLRHSDARNATIKVAKMDGELQVRISDDGRDINAVTIGNGLLGMRERVEKLQGRFTFNADNGFHINLDIPLTVAG
ncbi:MAG: sensor histidine kinase [Gammaproteobacteria bacterium]|nr:sensor histidine kinase [Gammaproteobacteria bacterium]